MKTLKKPHVSAGTFYYISHKQPLLLQAAALNPLLIAEGTMQAHAG